MLPQAVLLSFAILPVLASLADLAHCDPLKKDAHCPPDPAFAGNASFDFTAADWNGDLTDFWAIDEDSSNDHDHLDFKTDGSGVALSIWGPGQAPTLTSNKYILFGRVSVDVLAAQGPGLITAIVLKSDSGDEIDWELLGAYDNQAQTNYFYDGQALFNTYNTTYPLNSSSFSTFHRYSIDWSPRSLVFSIDGQPRKTWLPGDIPPAKWPQTPMQVKLGIWAVNNDSDPGEIAWAGGVPAFDAENLPRAFFKTIELEDYTGFCNETVGDVEFLYNERTRGWGDIQIIGCGKRADVPGVPDITDPGTLAPTATGSGTGTDGGDGTQPTGTGEAGPEETGDDEGAAGHLSSPLAAVLLLGWVLLL